MKRTYIAGGIGWVVGIICALFLGVISGPTLLEDPESAVQDNQTPMAMRQVVEDHARAWETGDLELLKSTMHPDIVFAYPGRRLNFDETVEDLEYFAENFEDTHVYINHIIIEGDRVAVEWQFASTDLENGKRTAVSDGIIGRFEDGKIIEWKEYLDGRVSRMQKVDALPLEEGQEPFPAPSGSLRNYCDVVCTQ